jgi:Cu(I)/Ag(I) efflux system membrane fusion protein
VVRRTTLHKTISLVGVVATAESHQANVSARFRGRIEKLHVNYTGEIVVKGQPLFELYSPDLVTAQQEFLLALDAKQITESLRDRLSQHFGMTNEQIADLEQAHKVQNTVQFNSPISGTVIAKQVQAGQYVEEGTTLYQLAELSKVWINLDVYEKDVRYIKVGQLVHISNEAYAEEEFSGRVTFIDPVMNPETRTVRVRTEFSNALGKLKPNMFVKATVSLPIAKALVVPSSAVLFTGKRSVVWVEVQPNTFEPRDVAVGSGTNESYEIFNGVTEGESVAISGGFLIDSESALRQPTAANPHAGHGTETKQGQPAEQSMTQINSKNDEQEIHITVKGGYEPNVIRAKVGVPVRLHIYRDEDTKCTREIIFEELNIRRTLPAFKTTIIELTPKESREIHFVCGEGMVHGKLIVE